MRNLEESISRNKDMLIELLSKEPKMAHDYENIAFLRGYIRASEDINRNRVSVWKDETINSQAAQFSMYENSNVVRT